MNDTSVHKELPAVDESSPEVGSSRKRSAEEEEEGTQFHQKAGATSTAVHSKETVTHTWIGQQLHPDGNTTTLSARQASNVLISHQSVGGLG